MSSVKIVGWFNRDILEKNTLQTVWVSKGQEFVENVAGTGSERMVGIWAVFDLQKAVVTYSSRSHWNSFGRRFLSYFHHMATTEG